jgi:hypothetical protein
MASSANGWKRSLLVDVRTTAKAFPSRVPMVGDVDAFAQSDREAGASRSGARHRQIARGATVRDTPRRPASPSFTEFYPA